MNNHTHFIYSKSIIKPELEIKIIEFASGNPSVKKISSFLNTNFSIDATDDKDIISGYNHDWSNMIGNASILCRPQNSTECAIIIRLCYLLKIKITISAGRTNLTGSATPNGGLILSIEKMNKINNLDTSNKLISVNPGVYIEEVRKFVTDESGNSLIFVVDPTSRNEAMIGGAVSCNASGFIPGPKGSMRMWVHQLEFLLPNGEQIKLERGQYISKNGQFIIKDSNGENSTVHVPRYKRVNLKNASGPFTAEDGKLDLIDLIVGSEGIFGCITNVHLKLSDKPNQYINLFIKLRNEEIAFNFYNYIHEILNRDMGKLSAFEYFGNNCKSFMNHYEHFFNHKYSVGIYMQIPLYNDDIDSSIEEWYEILMRFNEINEEEQIMSLNDANNWKTFFEARHSIPANALRKSKEYNTASVITDTIVPPHSFNDFIKKTHSLIKSKKIDYLLFGHLGDCHLHFHLIPNAENESEAIKCYRNIIQISSNLGGIYSAEHGTGKRKKNDFIECYGMNGVKEIIKCKMGFDPYFLFNNGNVIDK